MTSLGDGGEDVAEPVARVRDVGRGVGVVRRDLHSFLFNPASFHHLFSAADVSLGVCRP